MADPAEHTGLRVSVIIPTYNRAGYLHEALVSIFNQTLPPWEVIVVDDGSTDDTAEVVRNAAGPVRFHRQDHQGVAAARNLGLAQARGDLIAWLDSDDLWEPDFLATVVPLLAEDPGLGGAYTGITMIDDTGAVLRTSSRVESPGSLYDALVRDCFLATPSIVVRKTCFDQIGGFDPQFRISEDYDMWLRLSKHHRFVGVCRPLVRIRVHAANTMSDVDTLVKARLALTRKHFGELEGDGSALSDNARMAHGFAFRSIALKYIEYGQPSSGWPYLERAAVLHPAILQRLDTFYELACGNQPRSLRGKAELLDVKANGVEMLQGLDRLFASAGKPIQALRGAAYGNAYLSLGMLSDQAGDWFAARGYLLQAARYSPRLISGAFLRRLLKLSLNPSIVNRIKSIPRKVD